MNVKIETVDDLVTIIQVCAWAFVVVVIMLVFGGTVFSMLYSVIFVSQPIKTMAPIDAAFTKMLNDIVLLLTGSISTIAGMFAINKGARALANKLAPTLLPPPPLGYSQPQTFGYPQPAQYQPQYQPQPQQGGMPNFNWMGFQNPELDEDWRPPPPPTTPPDHLHPEREEIANERAAARSEQ
jgi:hypothetical protein